MSKFITAVLLIFLAHSSGAQDLFSFKDDKGRWGFKNQKGEVVIAAKYEYAFNFSEGLAYVHLKGGKPAYVDSTGREVIPAKYEKAAWRFSEGAAYVSLGGKFGFIDKTGKEIIPTRYEDAGNFREGLAWVKLDGKYGYIDMSGKEVIPFLYKNAGNFSEGLAYVELNKYGFIDKTGKEVIFMSYTGAGDFSEGLARVRTGGYIDQKWGFIDNKGNEVIPKIYAEAGDFKDGVARVKSQGGRTFYINYWNEEVPSYSSIKNSRYAPKADFTKIEKVFSPSDGMQLARDKTTRKYGYLNKRDQVVIPFDYTTGSFFEDNRAPVTLNGRKIYIDKTGKEVINAEKYVYTQTFGRGMAVVQNDKKLYAFIDTSGNLRTDFVYSSADGFGKSGLAKVCKDGKCGYLGLDGKPAIPLQYLAAGYFSESGLAHVVTMEGKHGYINARGEFVIPAIYDEGSDDWNLIPNSPSGWPYHTYMVKTRGQTKYFDANGKEVVVADPYEVARYLKAGVAADLVAYAENCGNKYQSMAGADGSIEYTVKGKLTEGIEKFTITRCGSVLVRYKFKTYMQKISFTNEVGQNGYVLETNLNNYEYIEDLRKRGYISSPGVLSYKKDAINIVIESDGEYWIIDRPLPPLQNEPATTIRTKTHTLNVYCGWAGLFRDTEKESSLRSEYGTAYKPWQVFADAPNGWLKSDRKLTTLYISFSERENYTLEKAKQDFLGFASRRSKLPKEKIRITEEQLTLPGGRKALLLFYVCPDGHGMVGGNYFNCELYFISEKNKSNVINYAISSEGVPDLPQKDVLAWKNYFKKVLLSVKPN